MNSALLVAALVAQLLSRPGIVPTPVPERPPQEPYVLLVPQPGVPLDKRTPVGLLYTPAVLATLVSNTERVVNPLVTNAIEQRTPIIVLWQFHDGPPLPEPFEWLPQHYTAVVPPNGNELAPTSPGPLWAKTDASFIRALDLQSEFVPVALVVAYRADDVIPGRLVYHWQNSTLDPQQPGRRWGRRIAGEIPVWR